MTMEIALIWIGFIFTLYVLLNYFKYGILPDISSTFYMQGEKLLFTIWVWAWAFPLMYIGGQLDSLLLVFSGVLFAFTGASPAFKTKGIAEQVHVVGAMGGVLLSMLALGMDFNNWLFPILFLLVYGVTLVKEIKNNTYYVELIAFIMAYIGIWFAIC